MNAVCGGLNGYRSSPTGAFVTARTLGFSLYFPVASCLKLVTRVLQTEAPLNNFCGLSMKPVQGR